MLRANYVTLRWSSLYMQPEFILFFPTKRSNGRYDSLVGSEEKLAAVGLSLFNIVASSLDACRIADLELIL
jgi:hypothetical protein